MGLKYLYEKYVIVDMTWCWKANSHTVTACMILVTTFNFFVDFDLLMFRENDDIPVTLLFTSSKRKQYFCPAKNKQVIKAGSMPRGC